MNLQNWAYVYFNCYESQFKSPLETLVKQMFYNIYQLRYRNLWVIKSLKYVLNTNLMLVTMKFSTVNGRLVRIIYFITSCRHFTVCSFYSTCWTKWTSLNIGVIRKEPSNWLVFMDVLRYFYEVIILKLLQLKHIRIKYGPFVLFICVQR